MVRDIIKSPDGLTRTERWTCQSATERDAQMGILPWPIPTGYEVFYRWLSDMVYEVGLRPMKVPTSQSVDLTAKLQELNELAHAAFADWKDGDRDSSKLHDLIIELGRLIEKPGHGPRMPASPVPAAPATAAVTSTNAAQGTATVEITHTHPFDADVATLAKWKREDLRTLATQESIALEDFLKGKHNVSNLQAAAFVKEAWEARKKAGK